MKVYHHTMARIPNTPSTLTHEQCISLLTRIQEACFLELQIINDSPMYVWSNEKPGHSAHSVSTAVASIMLEAGLNPRE